MSKKRKDSKGRVLRTGESQRKDGTYQYRYTDATGKRGTVYDRSLEDLRKKEKDIQHTLDADGLYAEGSINMYQFVRKYVGLKRNLRAQTLIAYNTVLNQLEVDPFCCKRIRDIKTLDAKSWAVSLSEAGRAYAYVRLIFAVVRPAFQEAVEDGILIRNPFAFSLANVIDSSSKESVSLNAEQEQTFLNFVEDSMGGKHLDAYILLLDTGLRISELCGLTMKDIDLEKGTISVNHQLSEINGQYVIGPPKSESGYRTIPLSPRAKAALAHALLERQYATPEFEMDGHSGFVFLCSSGKPRVSRHYYNALQTVMKKYARSKHSVPLPNITPHTLRHTFCTNLIHGKVDPTSVQYLMGHSAVDISLLVYSHKSEREAHRQLQEHFNVRDSG